MSGGGGKPRGGRICLGNAAPRSVDTKAASKELEAAEAQLAQQEERLRQLRKQSDQATATLKQAEAQLAQQERELPRAQMELDAHRQKAQDLQQRLQELQAATQVRAAPARSAASPERALSGYLLGTPSASSEPPARWPAHLQSTGEESGRVAELEASIKAGEKKLAELNKGAAALQQQAASLQQQVDSAGGEKLRKQRALVAKLGKALEELEADATKKGVQVKSSQKQLDKLCKEIGKQGARRGTAFCRRWMMLDHAAGLPGAVASLPLAGPQA
jgi:structural maintenance of chromosome 4